MDNDLAIRFDFHVHTDLHIDEPFPAKLAAIAEREQVRMAKTKGLCGFALTNHEFDKDTFERVSALAHPMVVVPAQEIEVDSDGTHIIALGIKKNVKPADKEKVVKEVHKQGGIAVLAHPFRMKYKVSSFQGVDGAEVWNGSRIIHPNANLTALAVAEDMGESFLKLGGSDSHFMLGFAIPGRASTLLRERPRDWQDLVGNIQRYVIGVKIADSLDGKQLWMPQDFEQAGIDPDMMENGASRFLESP